MSWIDDIGQDAFFKGLAAAVKGESGPALGTKDKTGGLGLTEVSKIAGENVEALKKLVQQVKDTTKTSKMFATVLEGGKASVPDFTDQIEQLNKTLEENNEKIKKAGTAAEIKAIEEQNEVLQQRKRAVAKGAIEGQVKASAINLAAGFASAAYGLVIAGMDLTKGIIEGQDAITSAVQAQIAAIKATAQIGSTIGDTMSSLSGVAAMVGMVSKRFGVLGLIISGILAVAGPLIKLGSEKTAELATKGLEILAAQLKQVRKGFYDLNESGVSFANGMTGMVQTATRAGLRVEDFAAAVGASREHIEAMGGGMSLATQRLAGISGEIRKGNLGKQLNGLGIELKDQAKVAAAAAAQMQASGRLRTMTDAEVANQTVKYARNLKILQEFAGKDAEKKLEQARKEAMYGDIRAKLMREDPTGKAFERFEHVFANTAPQLQKGLLEKISFGTVIDTATNIAMQGNQGIGRSIDESVKVILKGGDNFANEQIKINERLRESTLRTSEATEAVSRGARVGTNSVLQGSADISAGVFEFTQKFQKGTADQVTANVDAAKNTKDALTNATYNLDKASNDIAVSLQSRMIPAITQYADVSRRSLETVSASLNAVNAGLAQMIDKLKEQGANVSSGEKKGFNEKFGETTGGIAGGIVSGAVTGGFVGSFLGPVGTALGGLVGGVIGGIAGSKLGGWIGKQFDKPTVPPAAQNQSSRVARATQQQTIIAPAPYSVFAKGGITDKAAIFGEAGPEAAVPLPDGRRIPVQLTVDTARGARLRGEPINMNSATANITDKLTSIGKLLPVISPMLGVAKFASQALKPAAPDGNAALAQALRMTGENRSIQDPKKIPAVATTRKESEKTVDDIAMIMEAQLSKQEAMIKTLKDILTVNKGMLSAYS